MLPRILKNLKSKKNFIFTCLIMAFFLYLGFCFAVEVARAQDTFGIQPIDQNIVLGNDDIRVIIAKIIRAVFTLLGVITLGLILYAGYTIMTSQGNEEKIMQGKKIIINAVIGLAIILSALAIVQFVINALTGATTKRSVGGPGAPRIETYAGSGALGKIVKDHYPFRDQKNVYRNTKIIITLFPAVNPSSIIENTNNTCWPADGGIIPVIKNTDNSNCAKDARNNVKEYYGDCLDKEAGFSWLTDCDQLKLEKINSNFPVEIFITSSTEENYPQKENLVRAAALTNYDAQGKAQSFVFRPIIPEYLGSEIENVPYTVILHDSILKESGESLFANLPRDYYKWEFETGTNLDFSPPQVVKVSPRGENGVARNEIIRINFNEAMDPTSVQGVVAGILSKSSSNIIFNTSTITGEWRISNGYRTVEFIPSEPCGTNSCGDIMYCLPVKACENPLLSLTDPLCQQKYEALIRTAKLIGASQSSFESLPFSGAADIAGNGLDGNKDGKPDDRPPIGSDANIINNSDRRVDNFDGTSPWYFSVSNTIDRSAPIINEISPAIDAEGVKGDVTLKINFSKDMLSESLSNIILKEHPENYCYEYSSSKKCVNFLDSIWYSAIKDNNDDSLIIIKHRDFGPNNTDLYYFPVISSKVLSATQNCLYPGRGPVAESKNANVICNYEEDKNGNMIPGSALNCVAVTTASSTDTGCIQTVKTPGKTGYPDLRLQRDTGECLNLLKTPQISPVTTIEK